MTPTAVEVKPGPAAETGASNLLSDELNWAAAVISHHAVDLNRFVACRDAFEGQPGQHRE